MSVKIEVYYGNVGNHMFQYFSAFLYSHIHDLYLETSMSSKMQKFIHMKKSPNEGKQFNMQNNHDMITLTCEDINGSTIRYEGSNKTYIFQDYFQHSIIFNRYVHVLLSYFEIIPELISKWTITEASPSPHDVIVFVRLGDFIHEGYNSEIVHPSYIYHALQQIEVFTSVHNVYMVIHPQTDSRIQSYMDYLSGYRTKLRIIPSSARNERFDFTIAKYFDNIIITNSTFNWWSIFFQDKLQYKRVFTPKYMGFLGIDTHKRCHGNHVKDLWNIRNMVHPIEHEFIQL